MKTLTVEEIRKAIVNKINKLEVKRYGRVKEEPYFLQAYVAINSLENNGINNVPALAKVMAAHFDPMTTTAREVRHFVEKLYYYYDDGDLLYWGNDD